MSTKLILGYDGSDCAKTALSRTIDLAGAMPDSTVVVVCAYELSLPYVPMGVTDSALKTSQEFDAHAQLVRDHREGQVDQAAEKLAAAGVRAEKVVAEGHPVEVLLETATEHDAALIVVGSHGHGTVSTAFLGSTALKLLHHSKLPVLVVPRHDKE